MFLLVMVIMFARQALWPFRMDNIRNYHER